MTNDDKYNDRETKQNPGQSSQQDTDEYTITVEYGTFPPVSNEPPMATTTTGPAATATTTGPATTTTGPTTTTTEPATTTTGPATTMQSTVTAQPLNLGDCSPTTFDAIVIGAGMAGLSAAQELSQAGKSYIVVERSERVGGRMMSKDFAGEKVEFGK
jgi:hypothetical protein